MKNYLAKWINFQHHVEISPEDDSLPMPLIYAIFNEGDELVGYVILQADNDDENTPFETLNTKGVNEEVLDEFLQAFAAATDYSSIGDCGSQEVEFSVGVE